MADSARYRWWMRLAIGFGGIAIAGVVGLIALSMWTGGRFGARLAAIRAGCDPVSIAELAPKPIPADENAAAVIEALNPQIEAFAQAHGAFFKTDLGKAYDAGEHRFSGAGTPPDQLAAIGAIVEQFSELKTGVSQAAACSQYASVADFSLDAPKFNEKSLDRMQQFRALGRFQAWQIEILVGEKKLDEAVKGGVDLLKLARLHEAEPTLMRFLTSIAVRMSAITSLYGTLAAGPVSAEMHAALEVELARQDESGQLSRVLRTERAFSIGMIDAQAAQSSKIASAFAGMILKRQYAGVLDLYEALLPAVDLSWYDPKSPRQPGGLLAAPPPFGVLAGLLTPSIEAAYEAHNRDVALVRSLRIFNALRAFAEKNGREASGLADLDLPAAATIDPITGQPMQTKLTPQGWTVYSLGKDETDDGGAVDDLKDWGVGPPKQR